MAIEAKKQREARGVRREMRTKEHIFAGTAIIGASGAVGVGISRGKDQSRREKKEKDNGDADVVEDDGGGGERAP